jgi:hypothetical protein
MPGAVFAVRRCDLGALSRHQGLQILGWGLVNKLGATSASRRTQFPRFRDQHRVPAWLNIGKLAAISAMSPNSAKPTVYGTQIRSVSVRQAFSRLNSPNLKY